MSLEFQENHLNPQNLSMIFRFINHHLITYCRDNEITFTRSQPGNKMMAAMWSTRNWSRVRMRVGYARYDTLVQQELLNQLWELDAIYMNFLQPSQKLVSKTRDGAKISKTKRPDENPLPTLNELLSRAYHARQNSIFNGNLSEYPPCSPAPRNLKIMKKTEHTTYRETNTKNTTKTNI